MLNADISSLGHRQKEIYNYRQPSEQIVGCAGFITLKIFSGLLRLGQRMYHL